MKFINLISGPRNISTALMYSFAQRADTTVMDEPFYAVYLRHSGAKHPGADDVLASMSANDDVVVQNVFMNRPKPLVFIKNMAHHIEVIDNAFLKNTINVFLIRDPKQIIASYAEVIDKPQMRDIGIQYAHELFHELKQQGQNPVVIDSGLLLQNPGKVLKALCDSIGIPFDDSMLQWPAGPKPYDGVWAPHWYTNVHRSTSFEKQSTSSRPLPSDLAPLYMEAAQYYEKLLSFAIKA